MLGDKYHLYLVSNCMKPELRKLQIVRNPSKEYEGRFAPMVYRVMG
ncbi:hypothetical protein IU514_12780 [Lysobacter niastensis]|uniref:Uncharacterized protein n=2 Tax=Lysobacter niastensis TaxID=380629 RepID=A0ABS0B794_9GAMM|nr:hypothetical protein [Lysobacter niastensis]